MSRRMATTLMAFAAAHARRPPARVGFASAAAARRPARRTLAAAAHASPALEIPELGAAMRAVQHAGALCARVQASLAATAATGEELSGFTKPDASVVTVADFACQAAVTHLLGSSFPDIVMVAEEDADTLRDDPAAAAAVADAVNACLAAADADAAALTVDEVLAAIDRGGREDGIGAKHWVLDPIDGTKGFVNSRQYAIALALVDETGGVVHGVLGCPNLPAESVRGRPCAGDAAEVESPGVLVAASRGAGCFVASLGAADVVGAAVAVPPPPPRARSELTYMESYGDSIVAAHGVTRAVAVAAGIDNAPIPLDSQAKYAAIARGDADVYVTAPAAAAAETTTPLGLETLVRE